MAEQALQQRQSRLNIIFDQQMDKLDKYYVIVLSIRKGLTDEVMDAFKGNREKGRRLVVTLRNTGMLDGCEKDKENRIYLKK